MDTEGSWRLPAVPAEAWHVPGVYRGAHLHFLKSFLFCTGKRKVLATAFRLSIFCSKTRSIAIHYT